MLCSECGRDMVAEGHIGSDGWLLMNWCCCCGAREIEMLERSVNNDRGAC